MSSRPDANDPKTLRYRFRSKRFARVEALLRDILKKQDEVQVLDVGGRRKYWAYMPDDLRPKVNITIINLDSEQSKFASSTDDLRVEFAVGNGCSLPQFEDGQFDLTHSNSVIEHVGSLANMERFASETRRVGKAYYVQAPHLWFPIEPHFGVPFFQYLPSPTRAQILNRVKVGFTDKMDYAESLEYIDSIILPDRTMMKRLFPDGELHRERFVGLTKSLTMIRPL